MKSKSLKLFLASILLTILFGGGWLVHGALSGALMPTYQDPSPDIQARMAVHVPIGKALFWAGGLFFVLSVISGIVHIAGKFFKKV